MDTTIRPSRRPIDTCTRCAAVAVGAVLACAVLGGCTTSKVHQRYARHLSTVVQPDAPGHVDEVALVFGLDGAAPSSKSTLAAGPDNAWASRALTAAAPLPHPVD